mmetsp:Transcript_17387/g.55841  ORF Transcript_17387/g.55841 Transcript_17387/m.55841 type:complete len:220 (+) Transcript_17387:710-1369(+)
MQSPAVYGRGAAHHLRGWQGETTTPPGRWTKPHALPSATSVLTTQSTSASLPKAPAMRSPTRTLETSLCAPPASTTGPVAKDGSLWRSWSTWPSPPRGNPGGRGVRGVVRNSPPSMRLLFPLLACVAILAAAGFAGRVVLVWYALRAGSGGCTGKLLPSLTWPWRLFPGVPPLCGGGGHCALLWAGGRVVGRGPGRWFSKCLSRSVLGALQNAALGMHT